MYVRRCQVTDENGIHDGYFHRWVNYTGYIIESNKALTFEEEQKYTRIASTVPIEDLGVISSPFGIKTYVKPMGLVEFYDGAIRAVNIEQIQFLDTPYYGQKKGDKA